MDSWYDNIFKEAQTYYSFITNKATSWFASGPFEITMRLNDSNKVVYNSLEKSFRYLPKRSRDMEHVRDLTDDDYKKDFVMKFRSRLAASGLTYDELSECTGISKTTISYYLNGRRLPGYVNLNKLATALECSIGDLYYEGEE